MRSKLGFSLVELMVVVGIMAILAAIAVPRFANYQNRARLAEARNLLSQIFTLEEVARTEGGAYITGAGAAADLYPDNPTTFNGLNNTCTRPVWATNLGFEISPCVNGNLPIFTYTVVANGNGYTATATDTRGVIAAGCNVTINENKVITVNGCN